MDVLSDVLDVVRLRSTVSFALDLPSPWGVRLQAEDRFIFHLVAHGEMLVEPEGRPAFAASAGDLVLIAPGHPHVMRDAKTSPVHTREELFGALARRGQPTAGGTTGLVCGCFHFDDPAGEKLFSALPPVIVAPVGGEGSAPWLERTVDLIGREAASQAPGARAVVNRLCDALFVFLLREELRRGADLRRSWLRALTEPQVGAAMRLIHERPNAPWTVGVLASRVGMSRSSFAARFNDVVGETPMQYVTTWRLRKAASLLREGGSSVGEVAATVGYNSEASFNKAFKRSFGVAPGAYRRSVPPAANVWA